MQIIINYAIISFNLLVIQTCAVIFSVDHKCQILKNLTHFSPYHSKIKAWHTTEKPKQMTVF